MTIDVTSSCNCPSTFPQRLRFGYSLVLLRQKQQKEITMPIISDEVYDFKENYQHDRTLILPPPERTCASKRCQEARLKGRKPKCNSCTGCLSMTQKFRQWRANPDALGKTISFRGKVFFCEMKREVATWKLKKVNANLTAPKLKERREKKKEYQKIDRILASSFAGTVHLMLLLGISLYFFFSPITQAAFADFGAAMKDPSIRFWAVEHISIMTLVTIIVTIGSAKTKKALSSESKFKNQLVFFGISLALMLISIPWDRV